MDDLLPDPCRGCGRGMVSQQSARRHPELITAEVKRLARDDMCTTCYGRAKAAGTLPDPAPARPQSFRHVQNPPPPKPPLSTAELARLREMVGLPPDLGKGAQR